LKSRLITQGAPALSRGLHRSALNTEIYVDFERTGRTAGG